MSCERCKSFRGGEAVFRIRTEIFNIHVCRQCAQEARDLGLLTELLSDSNGIERKENPTSYRLNP
jgi:hypothetical protein